VLSLRLRASPEVVGDSCAGAGRDERLVDQLVADHIRLAFEGVGKLRRCVRSALEGQEMGLTFSQYATKGACTFSSVYRP
jgi:hypothetical protein